MKNELDEKKINFETKVEPESLELTADPELIEQVILNLLINAIFAVNDSEDPMIQLTSSIDERGKIIIYAVIELPPPNPMDELP